MKPSEAWVTLLGFGLPRAVKVGFQWEGNVHLILFKERYELG